MGNAETCTKRKEIPTTSTSRIQKKVRRTKIKMNNHGMEEGWVSLLSPSVVNMTGKWVSCIFVPMSKPKARAKNQLIFGQLRRRLEEGDDSNPTRKFKWEVSCCKPFNPMSGNDLVSEVPKNADGSDGELWSFYIYDIFCTEVSATYIDKGQWQILNMQHVLHLFSTAKDKRSREELLTTLLQ